MGCLGSDPPDPAKGYVAGINSDLETLPARRLIEAMARLGESGYVDIPGSRGRTTRQFYDFTGLGEADYNRQYGEQMAAQMLQLQRDFGPKFVEQRLAELEASDPTGAAMRRQLWDTVRTGAETERDYSDAQALQDAVLADLERGGSLDPETERQISQSVMGEQVARGNYLGNAAAAQEGTAIANAGEAERATRQQQALAFLTGQVSPADAARREGLQDMNNLAAFLAGESPTAQFGQLSGAQNGAAPFLPGAPMPGTNPMAGWQGVQNQQNLWSAQQGAQGVNPWVAGLSGAFNGVNLWQSWRGAGGGAGARPPGNAGGGWDMNFGDAFAGQV